MNVADDLHAAFEEGYEKGYNDGFTAGQYDAQREQRWNPVKIRPMTEEERQEYSELFGYDIEYDEAVMFECKMPDDGQDVWVCSKCGNVWQDACVVEEGICLEENGDWLDIVAWMPFNKPEPYREEGDQA